MTTIGPAAPPPLPRQVTDRLEPVLDEVRRDPGSIGRVFPATARRVGRGPLDPTDPDGVTCPTVQDAARVHVLVALERVLADRETLLDVVVGLYRDGDADERRAVVRALPCLDVGDGAVDLLRDALRTNDTRLVAAAMGPYAADHLDDAAWRHGVLKCLFTGVPLAAVANLEQRRDPELDRMVRALADERTAAGRTVPDDAQAFLATA
jgi:hypothetical protein